MDVAKLRILVDLDARGLTSGATAATAAITGLETGATRSLTNLKRSFTDLTATQKGLLGVGTAAVALGTALRAVIAPAIAFESAFAGVEKTVDGTPRQLAAIRDGLLDLSSTIPTAANDLADIAANAGQLGVAAPRILEFTESVAVLGETTDLSFEGAAQSLARFINVTATDAPVERLADVIVELGNNSATTESQILTFGQRLSTSFTLVGASADEILALGAAMSSLGIEAEAGASALNTSIAVIADAAKLGGTELDVLAETSGVTAQAFAELVDESPVEALLLFTEGLADLNAQGVSTTPTLEALGLNGIRVRRALEALGLGADLARDSLAAANRQIVEGGAAAEEAAKRYETTESRLAILENRLTAVAIALGTPALDLFAAGADAAGDAITELVDILRPLGESALDTFENLGQAVQVLFDVIGQPALQLFAAALTGAVVSATALLDAFNAFGPVGAVIGATLATITLYPGALATAASSGAALATTLGTVGVSGTAAAAATKAFQIALSTGPLIAFTAALIAVGKAFFDAGQAADAAAGQFRDSLTGAIEAADVRGVTEGLDAILARQEALRGMVATAESGDGAFTRFARAVGGAAEILTPFTQNDVLNAKTELEALNDLLGEVELGNFADSVRLAGQRLTLTEEAIISTATELGVLDDLTKGTTAEFYAAVDAIEAATEAERAFAEATGISVDALVLQGTTLPEIAVGLGLTTQELQRIAALNDDIDLAELLGGGEEALAALDAIVPLIAVYEELASQLGLTTSEYLSQVESVEALAAANSELRSTIDGAINALSALNEQQGAADAAAQKFADSLAVIGDTGGLEAAAAALRTASIEFAGTGVSAAEAAAKQRELYAAYLLAAEGAGISADEAREVAIALGLVPEAVLADITVEGEAAKAEADAVRQALEDTERTYSGVLDADPTPAQDAALAATAAALGFTGAEYVAFLEANGAPAAESIATARSDAEAYSTAEYVAFLEANGVEAIASIDELELAARLWADADYIAQLEAEGRNAEQVIGVTEAVATAYAKRDYIALLRAIDQASGVIRGANNELANFRDRNITLTATYRTVGSVSGAGVSARLAGGITPAVASFADGGLVDPVQQIVAAGVAARPGVADIYTPATPYRVFAEPATGGETYIPHDGDRVRNRNIWETHGQMMGFLRDGGILPDYHRLSRFETGGIVSGGSGFASGGGSVMVNAPISVDLANLPPNTDLAAVGAEIRRQIDDAFTDLGRQIINAP